MIQPSIERTAAALVRVRVSALEAVWEVLGLVGEGDLGWTGSSTSISVSAIVLGEWVGGVCCDCGCGRWRWIWSGYARSDYVDRRVGKEVVRLYPEHSVQAMFC